MSDKYFDKLISKKTKTNKLIDLLYEIPKKNTKLNQTHYFEHTEKNIVQQADLLFMPDDRHYKYALVVVDLYKRITDAVALKTKQPEEIVTAFKKIYSGKYLKIPKQICVDSGTEFKGDTLQYFKDNKVSV
jgi:hypothetical protein